MVFYSKKKIHNELFRFFGEKLIMKNICFHLPARPLALKQLLPYVVLKPIPFMGFNDKYFFFFTATPHGLNYH